MNPYLRFGLMIGTSTVVMYGLTYLNVASAEHIYFSQTRVYMALIMGSVMAVIMLGFMLKMYTHRLANLAIVGIAAVVFVSALALVRTQATVGDAAWMEAMIPHHSIAILTSENASLSDPQVRALADSIIATQKREIAEMQGLLADID